jgi:hypothetical protein
MAGFKSQEQFINESIIKHNNKYCYDKTVYKNAKTKIIVTCFKHGDFLINPDKHLFGQGCQECYKEIRGFKKRLTQEDFIRRSKEAHNNKYDYSESVYLSNKEKIKIKCIKHGYFFIRPSHHIRGHGCSKCGIEERSTKRTQSHESFIKQIKKIHGETFDYSKTFYTKIEDKIVVICKTHGEFEQTASKHLQGQGCPKCASSCGENLIRTFLQNNNIIFEEQKKFKELKNKNNLRFDFYLSDKKTIIEYNGKQHYYPIKFWGGLKSYLKLNKCDNLKHEFCKNQNIKFIEIPYFLNNIECINFLHGELNG